MDVDIFHISIVSFAVFYILLNSQVVFNPSCLEYEIKDFVGIQHLGSVCVMLTAVISGIK